MTDELTTQERATIDLWTPMAPPRDFADRVLAAGGAVPISPPRSRRRFALAAAVGGVVLVASIALLLTHRPAETARSVSRSEVPHTTVVATHPPTPAPTPAPAPTPTSTPTPTGVSAGKTTVALSTDAEVQVLAGEDVMIHDAAGKTAVQFVFDDSCPDGTDTVELANDRRFERPVTSSGHGMATVSVGNGGWVYRVRCASEDRVVASGRITVVRDAATRKLMPPLRTFSVAPDGRSYRLDYVDSLPDVAITTPHPDQRYELHLSSGGNEQVLEGSGPVIIVPGRVLSGGPFTLYLAQGGVAVTKSTSVYIDFDNTAPQVYVQKPVVGVRFQGEVEVRGEVRQGWSISIDGRELAIDARGGFQTTVSRTRPEQPIVLVARHPQRGVHYFIRRSGRTH